MKRYLVERPQDVGDSGVYLQDGSYYIYVTIRDIMTPHNLSTPSDVRITITDPLGTDVVSSTSMTNEATGEYSYDYEIPAAAPLGHYDVEVSTVTDRSRTHFDFYVLPWDMVSGIRERSGIEEWKSVSDEAVARIGWSAFEQVRKEVYTIHTDERPKPDPDTGNWFDGTTTEFRTKSKYIADYNQDGSYSMTTNDNVDFDGDINGWWYDENWERQQMTVVVDDAKSGKVTLLQDDGVSPIPRSQNGVFLTYFTEYHTFHRERFREAVEYLAAHKIAQRFHETDRATLVDLESNKTIFVTDPQRLKKLYKEALNDIREPACGGGS